MACRAHSRYAVVEVVVERTGHVRVVDYLSTFLSFVGVANEKDAGFRSYRAIGRLYGETGAYSTYDLQEKLRSRRVRSKVGNVATPFDVHTKATSEGSVGVREGGRERGWDSLVRRQDYASRG